MRVLYLHQYFTTPKHFGGVRSYQFARRLVEEGHDVDLITSTAFFPVGRQPWWRFISKHLVDGIRVHAIHVSYGNKMSFPRRVAAFLTFMLISSLYALAMRRRDLVYATSTPLTIAVPALATSWLRRVPLLFEVRDLWPDVPVAVGAIRSPLLIRLLRLFERCVYRVARRVVVLSPGMHEELIRKGVPAEKLVVVPNACDLADFSGSHPAPDALCRLRRRATTRLCLYAGTFGYVNDLDYLLDLASAIARRGADIKFVLIGDGMEKGKLQARISDEGLESSITLIPSMSKGELIPYIKNADICISFVRDIPELYNNSANKFFDALAAGRPIMINHGGWQAEVICDHQIGVVLDRDVEVGAEDLIKYFDDFEKFDSGRALGLASLYSRDALFEKLYKEAIEPTANRK